MKKSTVVSLCITAAFVSAGFLVGGSGKILLSAAAAISAIAALVSALKKDDGRN